MTDFKLFRRKFFMHSAHGTIGVSAGPAALALRNLDEFAAADPIPKVLRVCLVSGAPKYKSDQSLGIFERHLAEHTDVQCVQAFSRAPDDLPGLSGLEESDCMVLFTRRMTIDGEPLERVRRYCQRGGAVVGLRSAIHGFQNWPQMDRELFGADYRGHFGSQSTEIAVSGVAKDHPVLAGVEPLVSAGALYRNPRLAHDATVLLTGALAGSTQPVAWVRPGRHGRVFYTSLGHPDDFRQPAFLRLLANALHWACAERF